MGGGNPPTTTINPAPVLRPADYRFGQSFWNNVMPHLLGRQLPQFTGQIDPGMGPTSQMAMQMAQGYGLSPSPYTMGQAQGLLGNIMGGGLNNWQYQPSPQAQNTLSRFMNPQMPSFGGTNFFGQGGSPWGAGGGPYTHQGFGSFNGYGNGAGFDMGRNPWGGSVPGDMGMGAFSGPMLGTGPFGNAMRQNPDGSFSPTGAGWDTYDMPGTNRMTSASPYPGPSGGIYNAPDMGGMIQTGTYYGQVGNPGEPGYRPAIPDPYGGGAYNSPGMQDQPPGNVVSGPPQPTNPGLPSPRIYGDPPIMGGGPPVEQPSGPGAPPPTSVVTTPETPTAPAPPANRPGAPAYDTWRRQMQGTHFGGRYGYGQDAYNRWLQWFNSQTGGGGTHQARPGGGGNAGMGANAPVRPAMPPATGGGGGFSAPIDNSSTTGKGGIGPLVGAMNQRPTILPGTPKPRVPRSGPRKPEPREPPRPSPTPGRTPPRLINKPH